MARYIDADAMMREFSDFVRPSNNSDFAPVPNWNDAVSLVGSAPTADVRENVHAHWEEVDKYGNRRCSNCEAVEHVPTLMGKPIVWNFCPNCGAQMDKRREDET